MAYEYDRFEREDGGGSFLMGLLAGTVLGAGLGMLFAPKAGSELRNQLTDQAGKLRATANDTYAAGHRQGRPDRRSRQGRLRPRAQQRQQHQRRGRAVGCDVGERRVGTTGQSDYSAPRLDQSDVAVQGQVLSSACPVHPSAAEGPPDPQPLPFQIMTNERAEQRGEHADCCRGRGRRRTASCGRPRCAGWRGGWR